MYEKVAIKQQGRATRAAKQMLMGNMTSGLANNILVRLERAALRVVNRAIEGEGSGSDPVESAHVSASLDLEQNMSLDGDLGLAGAE